MTVARDEESVASARSYVDAVLAQVRAASDESCAELSALQSSVTDAVAIVDSHGGIVRTNLVSDAREFDGRERRRPKG